MRHQSALFLRKIGTCVGAALLLSGAMQAKAQLPLFDGIDWTTDRGSITQMPVALGGMAVAQNQGPQRPGYNGFLATFPPGGPPSAISLFNNNPGRGMRRWIFPRTTDITPLSGLTSVTIDNPTAGTYKTDDPYYNPVPPFGSGIDPFDEPLANIPNNGVNYQYQDTATNKVRVSPAPPGAQGTYLPQQMAHARLFNTGAIVGLQSWKRPKAVLYSQGFPVPAWQIGPGDPANTADLWDYRSPAGGFSLGADPIKPWNYDYDYIAATHNDFLVDRGNGVKSPVTDAEVTSMPNVSPDVYAAIHNQLISIAPATPKACWSAGAYNMVAGQYYVDIHSPGDGTIDDGTTPAGLSGGVHPNCSRAFVRVSWLNTVDGAGNPRYNLLGNGVNDPVNSRIYVVDLSQSGWIRIASPYGPAVFPYDGTAPNQIVVTLYTLTSEGTDPTTNPDIASNPLITMDAVRFTQVQPVIPSPGLGPINNSGIIAQTGRILGPVVGTTKMPGTATTDQDLIYFAREETFPDVNAQVLQNPSKPYDPDPASPTYNPLVPDLNAVVTAPVFYCVDNRNGTNLGLDVPSINRVRWRYVGVPDTTNNFLKEAGGTSSASPLLANVRCRDGVVRTMVYFVTTNTNNSFGRIYAFDASGDPVQRQTRAYWIYPSYRPTSAVEDATGFYSNARFQYHDPNFKFATVAPYPGPLWGADQTFGVDKYYDGEIADNPAEVGHKIVADNKTVLPSFPGIQGSPLLLDDPGNPVVDGAQVLIVPGTNGRIYAFDAGGRGDFDPADITTNGTTQRLWTWPHFGADAYHRLGKSGTNTLRDEAAKGAFRTTPSFDPTFPAPGLDANKRPFFMGSEDGHMYAVNPVHDTLVTVNANQIPNWNNRLNWIYPSASNTGLGSDISTASLFKPTAGLVTNLYFTCGGRVYTLPESSAFPTNALTWVFPFTPNPPAPGSDPATVALESGFNRSAPITANGASVGTGATDVVYVLQENGSLLALDALGGAGTSTVLGQGQPTASAFTRCSPILLQLDPQPNSLGYNTDISIPMIVYSDDEGAIWGLAATPTSFNDLGGNLITGVLPTLWQHGDAAIGTGRPAAASLINGMIIEGGEDGQLRAYGIGSGVNFDQDTIGTGEPPELIAGPGNLSIDLRVLDVYVKTDWDKMMLPGTVAARKTPMLKDQDGGNIANGVNGAPNNIAGATKPAFAVDWGDSLYIAASGVYHAQPTNDNTLPLHGLAPPIIRVEFTVQIPGRTPITTTPVIVPFYTQGVNAPLGQLWPDDTAISNGEHDNLKIYGLDANGAVPGAYRQFKGRAEDVYPWVAKIRVPIQPDQQKPFLPGSSGYRVTARAFITQSLQPYDSATMMVGQAREQTNISNILALGQQDFKGLNNPGIGGGPPFSYDPLVLVTKERALIITNPLALTVRSFSAADMTGNANANIVGWAGSINNPVTFPGELLGNGNRRINPVGPNPANSPIKPLFAPVGMIAPGSSGAYKAVNNGGNPVDALYIMDRSALSRMNGRALRVQVLSKPVRWAGGASSVMNPLPWEQLPTNGADTSDYPNISPDNLSVTTVSGQDAINSEISLAEPIFNNADPDPLKTRQPVPQQLNLAVKVPKFQPASVNRGLTTTKLPDGTPWTFGSAYQDISGANRGDKLPAQNATLDPILGPMRAVNGLPVPAGNPLAFPAGGYVSELVVRVITPGTVNANSRAYNPQAIYDDSRNDGASSATVQQAYRAFEIGLTVPPDIKMRVQETTLDTGKWAHGSGYSDIDPAKSFYRLPFSPTGSSDYPLSLVGNSLQSPWDVDQKVDMAGNVLGRGQMFRPFTLISESNVNLIDLRIAKLVGLNGATVSANSLAPNVDINSGTASAFRLLSDQVNALSISPLFAVPYNGPGVGYIGITSSFDHISTNSNPMVSNFNEHPLWPLANPYVASADITAVNSVNASLPVNNSPAAGVLGWTDGIQPQPTLGKPRVGDGSGRIATVPDMPHDAPNLLASLNADGSSAGNFFKSPEIGIAIPIGTPVGTYSNPVQVYEDNTPLQWSEWLGVSAGFGAGASHDAILNVTNAGAPLEPRTEPTFTLKVAVGESRLTDSLTSPPFQGSTLAQIDPFFTSPSANLLPAVWMATGLDPNGINRNMYLYWSTNRLQGGGLPSSNSPWALAYSYINAPYASSPIVQGDFNFNRPALNPQAAWWSAPVRFTGWGVAGTGSKASIAYLFPSTTGEQGAATTGLFVPSFLTGAPQSNSERHSSPSVTGSLDYSAGYNALNYNDREGYLFWQGQIDKPLLIGAGGQSVQQQRDTRTFWSLVGSKGGGTQPGEPVGPTWSLMNDPALTKLSPKPILVKLPARAGFGKQKFLFLFWHAGNASQTSIYYNVARSTNLDAPFNPSSGAVFSTDLKLPTPGALVWQSDPTPMYRHVFVNGTEYDAIDVVYTGVLKNRRTVEILLSRYYINRDDGTLKLLPLPAVFQETMTRIGTTNTYAARDASWALGTGDNGALAAGDVNGIVQIDWQHKGVGPIYHLNWRPDKFPQVGQADAASGLVYYDMLARDDTGAAAGGANAFGGGQIVVDTRSGTLNFPQIPPGLSDTIMVSYQPLVMRINTSRDETNTVRGFLPAGWLNDPAFAVRPAVTSPGNNTNAVAILDRGPNARGLLTAPRVMFSNGNAPLPIGTQPELDRLWVLYRKSDPSGAVKSTIYYKSMRLMARLPRPFALGAPNASGAQQLAANAVVTNAIGPYEVDWIRGRIYFTEVDEGNVVTINYTYYDAGSNSNKSSGNLTYRVAWGDEISTAVHMGDETTPEVVLPTDQAVNEGQVAAIKDPFLDKLWVFWSSTRYGTTDLFYETIAPQFYPAASNQR